jgi:hypothetical protein
MHWDGLKCLLWLHFERCSVVRLVQVKAEPVTIAPKMGREVDWVSEDARKAV